MNVSLKEIGNFFRIFWISLIIFLQNCCKWNLKFLNFFLLTFVFGIIIKDFLQKSSLLLLFTFSWDKLYRINSIMSNTPSKNLDPLFASQFVQLHLFYLIPDLKKILFTLKQWKAGLKYIARANESSILCVPFHLLLMGVYKKLSCPWS